MNIMLDVSICRGYICDMIYDILNTIQYTAYQFTRLFLMYTYMWDAFCNLSHFLELFAVSFILLIELARIMGSIMYEKVYSKDAI